jgi:hypothetical protein
MDFSAQLDELQQRAAKAKQAAQAAVSESRAQLRQRIDQARWTWTPSTPEPTPTNSPSKGGGNEQNRGPHRRRPS